MYCIQCHCFFIHRWTTSTLVSFCSVWLFQSKLHETLCFQVVWNLVFQLFWYLAVFCNDVGFILIWDFSPPKICSDGMVWKFVDASFNFVQFSSFHEASYLIFHLLGFLSCFSSLQVYEKVWKHSHLVYICACVWIRSTVDASNSYFCVSGSGSCQDVQNLIRESGFQKGRKWSKLILVW